MTSLRSLLAQLPPQAAAKGRAFERLVKWYLENEPEYKALLRRVHYWSTSPHRWGRDTGIDLTAEAFDGTLWAIQAKAYDPDYYVTKQDIDKFLSESGRQPKGRRGFDVRLLIATTDYLGANARAVLDDTLGARRLLLSDLEKSSIAWPRSLADLEPTRPTAAAPKEYQRVAIRDVVDGFRRATRGQLLMACGTGKTLTALWSAEGLGAKRVLVLVPSLALVRQTLKTWYANGKHSPPYKVVCSDESVHRGEDGDELVTTTSELPYPVTTEAGEVAQFIRRARRCFVFATYHSSPVIAQAFAANRDLPPFDLIVADEAHRISGAPDAAFATVLHEEKIRSKRRLFMTATPRYATGRLRKLAQELDIEIASMDDVSRFGTVFHKLTFADAIRRDLLTDYQVAVVVVDDETCRQQAERGAFVLKEGEAVDARTLACQLGLARSMRKFNLRKVVSFHSRVSWASAFAASFAATVALMPSAVRPSGGLWCRHVSGAQSSRDRDAELTGLKDLDSTTRGLVANARCLTEGVDVPTLDGVAFIDPRRSEVDVVQAVGRAIRKAPDKKIGTIVIPVFVGMASDAIAALESSAFKPVWQVIQALRAHDEVLAAELDALRRETGRRGTTGRLPPKIKLVAAAELGAAFFRAFDACLVQQTTASWEFWFGLIQAFVEREGHARVSLEFRTEDGVKLGSWTNNQRALGRAGRLSVDRFQRLETLTGWTWNPARDQWEEGFEQLLRFVRQKDHARVPSSFVTQDHFKLGGWVARQRSARNELSAERIERLSSLPGWTWNAVEDSWEEGFGQLKLFVAREKHARVPGSFITADGHRLGKWVMHQRSLRKKLSIERASRLERLKGWTWDPLSDAWEESFRELQLFIRKEGHARVSAKYVSPTGSRLGTWVAAQRNRARRGTLSPERTDRLGSLEGWTWDPYTAMWEEGFAALSAFVRREGHARVAHGYTSEDGFALGSWVLSQRRSRAKLTTERLRRLEGLPKWTWTPEDDDWEEGFRELELFVQREGHAHVNSEIVTARGYRLGNWVALQRQLARNSRLSAERRRRLEQLEGWSTDPRAELWEERYRELQEFVRREGHARVPDGYVTPGGARLGAWTTTQRMNASRGLLSPDRMKRLAALKGWAWDQLSAKWEDGFRQLEVFVRREGTARVPRSFITTDGFRLGKWSAYQRQQKHRLPRDKVQRLARLAGWTWSAET